MARRDKTTTYGEKGGTGPTAGLKTRRFSVTLPDGETAVKRTFHQCDVVGYAYRHTDGAWYLATLDAPNAEHLSHYTQCPAIKVTRYDPASPYARRR